MTKLTGCRKPPAISVIILGAELTLKGILLIKSFMGFWIQVILGILTALAWLIFKEYYRAFKAEWRRQHPKEDKWYPDPWFD